MKPNMPLIITISRQLGCGGAYIGEALANHFGISYADRDIIFQTAQKLSLHEKDIAHRDEKIITAWQTFLQSITRSPDRIEHQPLPPTDKELFLAEKEVIERLATERSAVIMGRCGSFILRNHPNHISIFLHAGILFRIQRLSSDCNVSEMHAQKMIAESDKKRSGYVHQFTGQLWMDATQYDLSVKTDILGVEESAEGIIKYVEKLVAEKESRN